MSDRLVAATKDFAASRPTAPDAIIRLILFCFRPHLFEYRLVSRIIGLEFESPLYRRLGFGNASYLMESNSQVAPGSSRIWHELCAFACSHLGFLPFAHLRQAPSQLQPGLAISWCNLQDLKKSIGGDLPSVNHPVGQSGNIEAQHLMSSGYLCETVCLFPDPMDFQFSVFYGRFVSFLTGEIGFLLKLPKVISHLPQLSLLVFFGKPGAARNRHRRM